MGLLEIVFPPRCAGCGDGPWPFCPPCRATLVVPAPPWCRRCARPLPAPRPTCRACPPPPLASARWPFLYGGAARSAIHRLKFSGWRRVASALAGAMAEVAGGGADAVCWVPLAPARRARRGYDQAEALARALAAELGLPAVR
ncbi:MAG TPA: double zinc ribbon domain-containing protein, partial [Actinomycetota bacterium]|nr:double zinc ribbon domain-containing protein [Actinomycetota bacterium]